METLSSLFLSPWAALFGLSLPALILLYLLKLKRTRREISSVLLWRRSLEDLTANAPFQRLRTSPLLLLQLLLLALLTLAMMRPSLNLESLQGVDYYVLLDHSASMASTDVQPNRFEVAKNAVRDLIDGMGGGDRMMIVTFADHSTVAVPLTEDRGELLSALRRLKLLHTGTSLEEAVTILEASIGDETERSRIHLYSDGAIGETENLFPPSVETVYFKIGEGGKNVGISRFSLSGTSPSGSDIQVFAELVRTEDTTGRTSLSLEWNGNLIDAHEFEWDEETTYAHIFRTPPIDSGLLTLRIDSPDDLLLDNEAGAFIQPADPVRILVVSGGYTPIVRALNRLPETQVEIATPAGYSATMEADLFVFDSWSPPRAPVLTKGAFYIGSDPSFMNGIETEGTSDYPVVLDWERTHPVTRGAEYRNLQVAKAARVRAPDDFDVLIESRDGPLLLALESGERRSLATTFELADSNWSRLYSFPITMANAVRWLTGTLNRMEVATVRQTGQPLEVPSKREETSLEVRSPSGESTRLMIPPGQGRYFSKTYETGVYNLVFSEEGEESVYFSLLDPNESRITALEKFALGRETIESRVGNLKQSQEVWMWFALAAYLILMIEWWFYTRQSWV